MQFSTIFFAFAASIMAVSAAPQGQASILDPVPVTTETAAQNAVCSSGVAQCCATVQDGAEAKKTTALLGLNDVAGAIGLNCQQVPINAIGAAVAVQNQCKNTAVCCTGSHANGLIQASCTPLSVN